MEFQIKLEDIGDFEKKGMPLCNLKEKYWFRMYTFFSNLLILLSVQWPGHLVLTDVLSRPSAILKFCERVMTILN